MIGWYEAWASASAMLAGLRCGAVRGKAGSSCVGVPCVAGAASRGGGATLTPPGGCCDAAPMSVPGVLASGLLDEPVLVEAEEAAHDAGEE